MALSPEQVSKINNTLYNIDDIEAEVDESIKNYHGWYPWEEALVDREFPVEVRNEVAKRYSKPVGNLFITIHHLKMVKDLDSLVLCYPTM